ncbi:MAG: stage II sporulation protein D [Clostridiales bacterium]|nr:stage II sporulation protein D [Clostridiales bacterium]
MQKNQVKSGFRPMAAAVAALLSAVFLLPLGLGETPRAEAAEGGTAQTGSASSGETPEEASALAAETSSEDAAPEADTLDGAVEVTVLLDGERCTLTLDEYLWGVVAAEMPAAFQEEALKAQAIAARTYTLYRMAHGTDSHDVALCGDPNCCQAWISREERLAAWPEENGEAYAEKIAVAIADTDGVYLTYGGEPLLAVFHASSGGCTRSALEVWGQDLPYLVSVASPEDDSGVPNYYSVVTVEASAFQEAVLEDYPDADLSGDPADWFGETAYDEAGLPVSLEVGGVSIATSELRAMFDLRSPTLTAEGTEEVVTFYVTGYGHGVGMSQYGANALAKEGKTAEEILLWYYTGAELATLPLEE